MSVDTAIEAIDVSHKNIPHPKSAFLCKIRASTLGPFAVYRAASGLEIRSCCRQRRTGDARTGEVIGATAYAPVDEGNRSVHMPLSYDLNAPQVTPAACAAAPGGTCKGTASNETPRRFLTLAAGGSVQILVTMTSSSTMTSPAFSCSGLPSYASCQVATSTVSSNGQSATSTVTLSIANQLSSLQEPGNLHLAMAMACLSATGFGLFGLVMFTGNRRQRAGLVLVAVIVVCVVSLAGCAGLVSSTTPPPVRFSFLVTGTAHENGTTATNSATVSITVN